MVHNPCADWHPGKGDNPTYSRCFLKPPFVRINMVLPGSLTVRPFAKWRLEDDPLLLGPGNFSVGRAVKLRGCMFCKLCMNCKQAPINNSKLHGNYGPMLENHGSMSPMDESDVLIPACCSWLSQWLIFKLLGVTYLIAKKGLIFYFMVLWVGRVVFRV